jgi:hypothetical protein
VTTRRRSPMTKARKAVAGELVTALFAVLFGAEAVS